MVLVNRDPNCKFIGGYIGATWNLCYIFTSGNIMVQQDNRAYRQQYYRPLQISYTIHDCLAPFCFPSFLHHHHMLKTFFS